MRWKDVCKLGEALPEVEEGTSFGVRALRVRGSLLAQAHDKGRAVVVKTDPDERARRCAARPDVFSVAPEHRNLPWMVVRLGAVERDDLWGLLVESWRRSAPPSLAASWDGGATP